MKTYPKIEYAVECDLPIYAFDKLDGSNVRAEWSRKRGWYKFGTRRRLVDSSDEVFGCVPALVMNKYGDDVARSLHDSGNQRGIAFFELCGPGSFAGKHVEGERLEVTLIDVAPFNRGLMPPDEFLRTFGHVDHARLLYHGKCTPAFIESVRESTLSNMTFEGVVCKSPTKNRTKAPVMFKQKSRAWLDRLRAECAGDDKLFAELS